MTVRFGYMTVAAVIFVAEIAIAVGAIGGTFMRGSVGDLLVIVLIYFLLRAISGLPPLKAVGFAIGTGFWVEALQYIHVAELLNLREGSALYIVVGNTFSPADLAMYVGGGLLALAVDQYVFMSLFPTFLKVSNRRS